MDMITDSIRTANIYSNIADIYKYHTTKDPNSKKIYKYKLNCQKRVILENLKYIFICFILPILLIIIFWQFNLYVLIPFSLLYLLIGFLSLLYRNYITNSINSIKLMNISEIDHTCNGIFKYNKYDNN